MKKILAVSILALLVGGVGYFASSQKDDGRVVGNPASGLPATLAGSSSNAVSLPRSQCDCTATSTDPALLDGNHTIQQSFSTIGADFVWLTGAWKAGTATSTVFIKQQGSFNQTTWFDVHASSTPALAATGTSTPILLLPSGAEFDPPVATTTFALPPFYTKGFPFTRFLFYAEDLTTDPNDGVQAFIQAIPVKQLP